jgi:hypothetical protein
MSMYRRTRINDILLALILAVCLKCVEATCMHQSSNIHDVINHSSNAFDEQAG